VTNNDGNEHRNANHPAASALTADIGCVDYNYQANGTNDTKRHTGASRPTVRKGTSRPSWRRTMTVR
jgi:hypothetical protein